MGDVINAQTIFAKNADYVTTVKRWLNDAEIMIRSGQGEHIASAFLRTQIDYGPTLAIRVRASALLDRIAPDNSPEPAA